MTTQIQSQPYAQKASDDSLLRNSLKVNDVFSLLSGLTIIATSGELPELIGAGSSTFYLVLGVALLVWAADVYLVSRGNPINTTLARGIFIGDVVWVLGSIAILLFDLFGLTTEGKWVVLIVADLVAIIAIAEYLGLRRLR